MDSDEKYPQREKEEAPPNIVTAEQKKQRQKITK
jgi:hypothetical protein